jgi:GAF domain-containing protein/anti-sigma regulatory factor (Ser/Thr protein kinase)
MTAGRENDPTTLEGTARTRDNEDLRYQLADSQRQREASDRYLAAVSDVLKVIGRPSADLNDVFATIASKARELCRAEWGHVVSYDGELVHLEAVSKVNAQSLEHLEEEIQRHYPRPVSVSGAVDRAIAERQVVYNKDAMTDAAYEYVDALRIIDTRSLLAVPMLCEEKTLGAIMIAATEQEAFDSRQIELLKSFADQAVIAIENARLFESEQERTAELSRSLDHETAISRVLGVISRSPNDLDSVLDEIVGSARDLCNAQYACIFSLNKDDGKYHVQASSAASAQLFEYAKSNPIIANRQSVSGRAIIEKRTVHLVDPLSDPTVTYNAAEMDQGSGVRLCVPLIIDDEVIGVLALIREELKAFNQSEIHVIETFADQAVIAIENARLFEAEMERTEELRQALEYQTATSEVLEVISGSVVDTAPVFEKILDSCERLFATDQTGIVFSEDKRIVEVRAWRGAALQALMSTFPRPLEETTVSQVIRAGHAIQIPNATAMIDPPPTMQDMIDKIGNFTVAWGPMLSKAHGAGAIVVLRQPPRPFSDKELALLETFADQAVIAVENARLFNETNEALERQTATAEILKVIASSPSDAQPVFDAIVRTAAHLFKPWRTSITMLEDGQLHWKAAASLDEKDRENYEARKAVYPLPMDPTRSPSASAILEKRIIVIADSRSENTPAFASAATRVSGFRSLVFVPMIKGDEGVGTIVLGHPEPRQSLSDIELGLVQTFADQAIIAIENARLFEAEQERTHELLESLQYQTATSDVLGAIARSATETQPVFDAIVANAARLCGAHISIIHLLDSDSRLHPAALHNVNEDAAELIHHHQKDNQEQLIARRAVDSCAVVEVTDIWDDPTYPQDVARAIGIRAVTGVPLINKGKAIGAISVALPQPTKFDRSQIELVETFARQAVIAIENARLFEAEQQRRRELQESVAQLEALGSVGQAVSSSLDLQLVLQTVLENAARMANAGGGTIYVFDGEANEFVLAAGHNMSEEHIEQVRAQPIRRGEPVIGECADHQRAVQIEDLNEYDGAKTPLVEILIRGGVRSVLAIPLLHQKEVIGAFVIRRNYPGPYAPETIQLLEAFAAQSAIAVNNASLFKEVEETGLALAVASEHKSQFLANMSHELRTPLNAILGYTELIQDGIYGEPEKKVSEVLGRVLSNGKHLLGLINDVLDLSKIEAGQVELTRDGYSLSDAVQTVVSATESLATEKNLELKANVEPSLPAGLGDERRLVQVLLNLVGNAIKFTDEGSVTISASQRDGRFSIAVTDTGPGIPDDELARIFEEFHQVDSSATKRKGGTGLGLAISKRIVELHGGELTVTSEVGVGSTFQVELPVKLSKQQSI